MNYIQRIAQLQNTLSQNQAYLISDKHNLRYLTGFITLTPEERECFLLIRKNHAEIFLSSFSTLKPVQAVTQHVGNLFPKIQDFLNGIQAKQSLKTIFFDPQALSVAEYEFLIKNTPKIQFISWQHDPVMKLRQIKDSSEQECIRVANQITHLALSKTLSQLRVGITEYELKLYFESECRKLDVCEFAFPTIVAFGSHSALPHHQPDSTSQTELKTNQAVLIDCGVKWQGYCADVTRTVWYGEQPSKEFVKIEKVVHKAYASAVGQIKKGILASQIDQSAREVINKAGYGNNFIHTTGHGVGLWIHEPPSLNWKNDTALEAGMVVTIEPGIYLPEKYGYRFENSLLISLDGVTKLE